MVTKPRLKFRQITNRSTEIYFALTAFALDSFLKEKLWTSIGCLAALPPKKMFKLEIRTCLTNIPLGSGR